MYRPTFAIDAIGRDDSTSLELAKEQMQILLDALTALNLTYIRRGIRFPDLLESNVRYDEQRPVKGSVCGDDDWADIAVTFRKGLGDCDDLAAIRAAQLQARGIRARAIPLLRRTPARGNIPGKHDYHIVVMWPKGLRSYPRTVYQDPSGSGLLLEDPSKLKGMR